MDSQPDDADDCERAGADQIDLRTRIMAWLACLCQPWDGWLAGISASGPTGKRAPAADIGSCWVNERSAGLSMDNAA